MQAQLEIPPSTKLPVNSRGHNWANTPLRMANSTIPPDPETSHTPPSSPTAVNVPPRRVQALAKVSFGLSVPPRAHRRCTHRSLRRRCRPRAPNPGSRLLTGLGGVAVAARSMLGSGDDTTREREQSAAAAVPVAKNIELARISPSSSAANVTSEPTSGRSDVERVPSCRGPVIRWAGIRDALG